MGFYVYRILEFFGGHHLSEVTAVISQYLPEYGINVLLQYKNEVKYLFIVITNSHLDGGFDQTILDLGTLVDLIEHALEIELEDVILLGNVCLNVLVVFRLHECVPETIIIIKERYIYIYIAYSNLNELDRSASVCLRKSINCRSFFTSRNPTMS